MIKILRQDRMSIYMTFDAKGNDKLISAFANILKNQICELNVTFDLSVINMKRTKLKDVSIILKIDIVLSVLYFLNQIKLSYGQWIKTMQILGWNHLLIAKKWMLFSGRVY